MDAMAPPIARAVLSVAFVATVVSCYVPIPTTTSVARRTLSQKSDNVPNAHASATSTGNDVRASVARAGRTCQTSLHQRLRNLVGEPEFYDDDEYPDQFVQQPATPSVRDISSRPKIGAFDGNFQNGMGSVGGGYDYGDDRDDNMFRRSNQNMGRARSGGGMTGPNGRRPTRSDVSTTVISDLRARALDRRLARGSGGSNVGGVNVGGLTGVGVGVGSGGGGGLSTSTSNFNSLTVVEKYFEAWNQRNIPLALSCFDDYVYYDDTQFSEPFEGKERLAEHLIYVADCLPDSFRFVVDGLAVGNTPTFDRNRRIADRSSDRMRDMRSRRRSFTVVSVGAMWHVENEYGPLPYARGCSFYKVDPATNLIVEGYDYPEPAVIKPGSSGLRLLSLASKLIEEPVRLLPLFVWVGYIYVVFFSDGILPGASVTKFEPRTWDEVRNLSLNFWFVAPLLDLPFSPKVHPMLEGSFNFLLAWAAMFAGFLSDDRSGLGSRPRDGRSSGGARYYENLIRNQPQEMSDGTLVVPAVSSTKRNLIPMLPMIIGMQFLTSAFLLPYLFTRTAERPAPIPSTYRSSYKPRYVRPLYKEELDGPARIFGEWKGLGIFMGAIGVLSVYWGFAARTGNYGAPLWSSTERWTSFLKLLSIDRVGSSFIVDFIIFGFFQGWLVDDDFKRRGRSQNPMEEETFLRNVAKFLPFWGLALYLTFRPELPSSREEDDYYYYNERRDDGPLSKLRDTFSNFNNRR